MGTRRSPRNQERLWRVLGGESPPTAPRPPDYTPGELYDLVVARGLEHDAHESDLYLRVTDASRQLIACYTSRSTVRTFRHAQTGDLWFDVPFAYAPFWRARCAR